jgi:hypothetical protein
MVMECARHEEYLERPNARYCGNCGEELIRLTEQGQASRTNLRSSRLNVLDNEVAWGGVLLLGYLTLNALGYVLATSRNF